MRRTVIVLFVIGVVVRLVSLTAPIRIDERITRDQFVRQPWADAVSLYPYPNNHVFHTVLAKASTSVFGDSLWALRLPALIAGLLIIPAAWLVLRNLYGERIAIIGTAIAATSPELVTFSVNARGYSFIVLAFLLLLLLAQQIIVRPAAVLWLQFAIVAALGMWGIPVMLFPLGAACLWLAMELALRRRYRDLGCLALTAIGAAAIALLLYTPVITREGLRALTGNEYVTPSVEGHLVGDVRESLSGVWMLWMYKFPAALGWVLGAWAVIGVIVERKYSTARVSPTLAALAWSALLLVVTHRAPPARNWQWLIPLFAGLAGVGVMWLLERGGESAASFAQRKAPALAIALALICAVAPMLSIL